MTLWTKWTERLIRVADRIGLDQLGRSRQRNPRTDFRKKSTSARSLRHIECYPCTLHRPNEDQNRYNRSCNRPWLCPFCSCRLYTKAVLERLMDVLLFKGCSRRESRIVGATWLVDPMTPRQQLYNIGRTVFGDHWRIRGVTGGVTRLSITPATSDPRIMVSVRHLVLGEPNKTQRWRIIDLTEPLGGELVWQYDSIREIARWNRITLAATAAYLTKWPAGWLLGDFDRMIDLIENRPNGYQTVRHYGELLPKKISARKDAVLRALPYNPEEDLEIGVQSPAERAEELILLPQQESEHEVMT